MSSQYQIYSEAAALVDQGWIKRHYSSNDGRVCLVGAIIQATPRLHRIYYWHSYDATLPDEYRKEVAAKLKYSPSFQVIRLVSWLSRRLPKRITGGNELLELEAWNDLFWRRKKTVRKLLEQLATEHKPKEPAPV